MRVSKHWHCVPREMIDAAFLRTLKASLGGAWSNLIQWKVSLLTAEGWTGWCLKVSFNPNRSRIPFLYYFCSISICIYPPAHTLWAELLQWSSSSLFWVFELPPAPPSVQVLASFSGAEQRFPVFHQLPSGRTFGMMWRCQSYLFLSREKQWEEGSGASFPPVFWVILHFMCLMPQYKPRESSRDEKFHNGGRTDLRL